MGILDTFFPSRTTQAAGGEYIPATDTALTRTGNAIRDSGTAMLNRGVDIYKANPKKIPYYLMLVGDPDAIPYRFQYELDVDYAVGRLSFETPQEYAEHVADVWCRTLLAAPAS